ncbi:MAG: hypothetical protein KF763_20510 [Cyclobacteriaceae bacterium]|nr:hypothetical protein [Cyclobacteriaceae bacterium]
MKTLKITLFVGLCLVLGQTRAQETSKVYFIRPEMAIGSAQNVFADDVFVCRVKTGHYAVTTHLTGEIKFSSRHSGKKPNDDPKPMTLVLESGKNHYLLLVNLSDGLFSRPTVIEITESYAKQLLEKMTPARTQEISNNLDMKTASTSTSGD